MCSKDPGAVYVRLFSFFLFSLSAAYTDEHSVARDFFIVQCMGCHAFSCNKEGPKLGGLIGRKAAGVDDYESYSKRLKDSGLVWTTEALDDFFKDPSKWVRGSMAEYGKIEDAVQRQKLIAFLKTEDPMLNLCPQE